MSEAARRAGRAGSHIPLTATPESSAVGSSASNGRAERAVQQVEDQIRVGKSALESKLKCTIPCNHPVVRWMVEHYFDVINKYSITQNCTSPCESLHGKKAAERRNEFGEIVYFSTPKKGRAKMDLRWKIGVYLGHDWASNEIDVAVKNGNVRKARSGVRVIETSRWYASLVQRVVGTPGDMTPTPDGQLTADDIERSENPQEFDPRDVEPEGGPAPSTPSAARESEPPVAPPPEPAKEAAWRRVRITAKDTRDH